MSLCGHEKSLACKQPGAPLLDFAERLGLRHRDKDDDSLLPTLHVDLTRRRNLKRAKLRLKLGDVVFEVDQSLGDAGLGFIGVGSGGVGGTQNLVLDGHVDS